METDSTRDRLLSEAVDDIRAGENTANDLVGCGDGTLFLESIANTLSGIAKLLIAQDDRQWSGAGTLLIHPLSVDAG